VDGQARGSEGDSRGDESLLAVRDHIGRAHDAVVCGIDVGIGTRPLACRGSARDRL
jgi:hypothetical protein